MCLGIRFGPRLSVCSNTDMAQNVHIVYVSDLSGKDITDNDQPTTTFGWDGLAYEVDLTAAEAEKFRKVVEPYIAAGRKIAGTKSGKKSKSATSGPNAAEVRQWAQANGIEVTNRGRVPQSVYDQYHANN